MGDLKITAEKAKRYVLQSDSTYKKVIEDITREIECAALGGNFECLIVSDDVCFMINDGDPLIHPNTFLMSKVMSELRENGFTVNWVAKPSLSFHLIGPVRKVALNISWK